MLLNIVSRKAADGQNIVTSNQKDHFLYVDSMRGWAILGVMFIHVTQRIHGSTWISAIGQFGQYGVQLFFVSSALTIFMSLERRSGNDRKPILAFFVRRVFRIAPLYLTGLAFYSTLAFVRPGLVMVPPTVCAIVANSMFVHAWHPQWINGAVPGGWSIGVEMTFYLLIPVLFRTVRNVKGAILLFLVSVAGNFVVTPLLGRWAVTFPPEGLVPYFSYFSFPSQFPVFACGILLYFLLRDQNARLPMRPSLPLMAAAGIGVISVIAVPSAQPFGTSWQHVTFGIAFICFAIGMSRSPRILVNGFTRYLGVMSYSLYLTHFFALAAGDVVLSKLTINHAPHPVIMFFTLALTTSGLSIAASALTYRYIEMPGIRLGRNIVCMMAGGIASGAMVSRRIGFLR